MANPKPILLIGTFDEPTYDRIGAPYIELVTDDGQRIQFNVFDGAATDMPTFQKMRGRRVALTISVEP